MFLELIGQVESYRVRPGTHAVADEAFKRHARVRTVELPEGVFSVGREAFRGNRQLVRVDLPESLERIGERAFLDTSLSTLRLSENVRSIGEDALLVQGDNQLMPRRPLQSISLDAANPVFYLENGLLCQRDGSKMGGDTCLLYVGPDDVVRIPRQVTHVASLAFCGASGVAELHLHGHLHSICNGAFSTARSSRSSAWCSPSSSTVTRRASSGCPSSPRATVRRRICSALGRGEPPSTSSTTTRG